MTAWLLFGASFLLLAILLLLAWRRMSKDWERSPYPSRPPEMADGHDRSPERKPLPSMTAGAFPAMTDDLCTNCDTPLPSEPADDGFVHCAYCDATLVTPSGPEFSPIPLQRQHTVGVTESEGQLSVRVDGQHYHNLDDILDPETRRVAEWGVRRYLGQVGDSRTLATALFGDKKPFAEEVETDLRRRLLKDALLRWKQVSLDTNPDGSLRIEVDGQVYESLDEIPGKRLRAIFQETIRDWERHH